MKGVPRHCIDCGTLTTATRCPAHDRQNHAAAYGGDWAKTSRAQRARTPHCQCPGCTIHNGPCPATTDLTADHIIPHAQGGTPADGIITMCRRCNAAKRDRPAIQR